MKWQGANRCACLLVLAGGLGLTAGCALDRPPSAAGDSSGAQQLPFEESKPLTVPPGAAIYVRLKEPLTSKNVRPGQVFSAVLDEPVVVDGQMTVAQGAAVTGKVVAARASGRLRNAGYIRVTLTSIAVNGKAAPVETNSIFAVGGRFKGREIAFAGGGSGNGATGPVTAAIAPGKKEVGFAAGQRLSFRLSQPFDAAAH